MTTVSGTFTENEACPVCRGPLFLDIHYRCHLCPAETILRSVTTPSGTTISAVETCTYLRGHTGCHSWEVNPSYLRDHAK